MKLGRLIIHNLASIADATLDFDAEPLKSSEVFLITGKTGAGKSTILDAICLALYNATPRMESTQMQGTIPDAGKELRVNDSAQLMRRNTGDAFVTLSFAGNNGVRYEATWSVQRSRRNPHGNLQAKKWQLTNLDTGDLLTKSAEIKAEMHAAIGLDFQQFCRTTMLAQGEFTRFLNSGDNDKAAILEKITGADSYSKIGQRVFQMTAEREQLWREARRQADDVQLLSETDVAAKREELRQLEAKRRTLRETREAVEQKSRWMRTDAEHSERQRQAEAALTAAKAETDNARFAEAERLVRQWRDTISARQWLKDEHAAARTVRQQQARLDNELRLTFAQLRATTRTLRASCAQRQAELEDTARQLSAQETRAEVFKNAAWIAGQLKNLLDWRESVARETRRKEAARRQTAALERDRHAAETAVQKDNAAFERQATLVKTQDESLQQTDRPALRKHKDDGVAYIRNVERAQDSLKRWDEARRQREEARTSLDAQEAQLKAQTAQADRAATQAHDAEIKRDTCRELYDRQRESVEAWAKNMRARLHLGDRCPVCRQQVLTRPDETHIDQLFAETEKAWQEADAACKALTKRRDELVADVRIRTRACAEARQRFDKDDLVDRRRQEAEAACHLCGLAELGDDTAERLTRKQAAATARLAQIEEQIKAIDAQEARLKEARAALEKLRKAKDDSAQRLTQLTQQLSDNLHQVEKSESLVRERQADIAKTEASVRAAVGTSTWTHDWQADTAQFAAELKSETDRHDQQTARLQQLQEVVRELSVQCRQAEEAVGEIVQMMPQWELVDDGAALRQPDLLRGLNAFCKEVAAARTQIQTAEQAARQAHTQLAAYLAQHPDITLPSMEELAQYEQADIAWREEWLQKLRNAVLERESALRQIAKQRREHAAQRPPMTETDTAETLALRRQEIEVSQQEIDQAAGALNLLLKQDADNRARLGALVATAEERRKVYEKWARLNQLIGDATGNKFRKIAQSYVLSTLIHSANAYMKSLSDRYTLCVEPGTFVISIEDAYQGFARRAASTISGGESFLVSLSLALALSDMGQRLSVDTLFIDEGFGTLSGEPLQYAIRTLRSLHDKAGRHVGIISHIEELRERIGVQIRVEQAGGESSSTVRVVAG